MLKILLLLFSLIFINSCELNRSQVSMLTGALDGYQEKLDEKGAKKVLKCKENSLGDLTCYEY